MNDSVNTLFNDTLECLPLCDKEAFLEAIQYDPATVFYETDSFQYLVNVDFNAWEAVARMMRYWEWKKKLFGIRWLRPLHDLSGNGALDDEDLANLWTGYFANGPTDHKGNAVILFDRSRLAQDWDTMDEVRNLRVFFYITAVASKELECSPPGCTIVAVNLVQKLPSALMKHSPEPMRRTLDSHAVSLTRIHNIFLARMSFYGFFIQFVIPVVVRNIRSIMIAKKLTFDLVFSNDSAKEKLAEYDIHASALSCSLGGTWDYSSFYMKLEEKRRPKVYDDICHPNQSKSTSSTASSSPLFQSVSPVIGNSSGTGHLSSQIQSPIENVALFPGPAPQAIGIPPVQGDNGTFNIATDADTLIPIQNANIREAGSIIHSIQLNFWSYHNFDNELASSHFSAYMGLRRALFHGRDTLPMNQTGHGMMSDEDVRTLETGFVVMLPKDRDGNFVIALEPCKARMYSGDSQRRCFFYMLYVLCEQQTTGKEKLVVLAFMNDIDSEQLNDSTTYVDVQKAFPIELDFLHIFFESTGLGWFSQQSRAEDMLRKLLSAPNDRTEVHSLQAELGDSFSAIYGLDGRHLPVRLGGSWTLEEFKTWQKHRVESEYLLYPPTGNIVTPVASNSKQYNPANSLHFHAQASLPVETTMNKSGESSIQKDAVEPFETLVCNPPKLAKETELFRETCDSPPTGMVAQDVFFDSNRGDDSLFILEGLGLNSWMKDVAVLDDCSIWGFEDEIDCLSINSQLFEDESIAETTIT